MFLMADGMALWYVYPFFSPLFCPSGGVAEYFRCCRNAVPVWRNGAFSVAERCLQCGGRGFSEARKSPFGMTEEALPHGCDGTIVMHDSANG